MTTTIAISGLGSIARQHIAVARAHGDYRIIAFDPRARDGFHAPEFDLVDETVATFDELLDARPHALVIASPDDFHVPQLRAALEAGVATLVEKPLAPRLADTAGLVGLARDRGVPVLMGYVLRHRRACRAVADLIAAGAIGAPITFQVMLGALTTVTGASTRFATRENDRLYRDYSHEWDYVRWFFGDIASVLAVPSTLAFAPHEESPNAVDGLLRMAAGFTGAFHIDYLEPVGVRTLHVLGSGGSILADFRAGTVRVITVEGTQEHELLETAAGPLGAQFAHLIELADGGAEPAVSLADGVAALATTEALIASAASGAWVDVEV